MHARIAVISRTKSGAEARRELVVDDPIVTIGRGTDRTVQVPDLSVALHHAGITYEAGTLVVQAEPGADLHVNGSLTDRAALSVDDVVRVGRHEIRVVDVGPGDRATLEVRAPDKRQDAEESARTRTRLGADGHWLSARTLSWIAAVLVPAVLLLPIAFREGAPSGEDSDPQSLIAASVRRTWMTGPLSNPHVFLGNRCSACHERAFTVSEDASCLTTGCHAAVLPHTPGEVGADAFDDVRCAVCHPEHGGDPGPTMLADAGCLDCHASIRERFPDSDLLDVGDFQSEHPQFRALVVGPEPGAKSRRVSLDELPGTRHTRLSDDAEPQTTSADDVAAARYADRTGLRYTHAKHLAEDLRTPAGRVTLECADCHQLDVSGIMFAPVRYDEHCRSCHPLALSAEEPGRLLPHTEPESVREAARAYFADKALRDTDPARVTEASTAMRRGRPGGSSVRTVDDLGELRSEIARRADAATRRLFEQEEGTCAECHVLDRTAAALGALPQVRAVTSPVVFPRGRWLSRVAFNHATHRGVTCGECHASSGAETSGAVLMPGIEVCRSCHGGGEREAGSVPSPCLACHLFHQSIEDHAASRRRAPVDRAVPVAAGEEDGDR